MNYVLGGVCAGLLAVIGILAVKMANERKQLHEINKILDDILNGNLNRRILANGNDEVTHIVYKINQMVSRFQDERIQARRIETANKRLMTSLSHDIRTPLTALIGYLEAINKGIVSGDEQEEYLRVATSKAHILTEYTNSLFEWFKLNSNERKFEFQATDINEITRNAIIEWIPELEKAGFSYDIQIGDNELIANVDHAAYIRILNNLIQNAVRHSGGERITVEVKPTDEMIDITISDNGKGISEEDISHIFERLYTCDEARGIISSGLGLSIVKELAAAHHGSVAAHSIIDKGTSFIISLPLSVS
jgi:signal transduction histidine kinase